MITIQEAPGASAPGASRRAGLAQAVLNCEPGQRIQVVKDWLTRGSGGWASLARSDSVKADASWARIQVMVARQRAWVSMVVGSPDSGTAPTAHAHRERDDDADACVNRRRTSSTGCRASACTEGRDESQAPG